MKFEYVEWAARERALERFPELARERPDLLRPSFEDNPMAMPDDFPFLFFASENGQVVGSRKSMPDVVWIGGEPKLWAWNFDTFVEPRYRGRGVGRKLVELQIREVGKRGIISGASFSAPATMRIYQKLGFQVLGHAPRMNLVRRTRPFLHSWGIPRPLLGIGSFLGDATLKVDLKLRHFFRGRPRLDLARIDAATFEEMFRKSVVRKQLNYWDGGPQWVLARRRSSDALIVASRSNDEMPVVTFVARERFQSDMIRGQERKIKRLSIMHFDFLDDGEDVPQIFASAVASLLEQCRADVADVITSFPPAVLALTARGFRSRGPGMSFCCILPEQAHIRGKLSDWHLTHFCSDGFMFD